MLRNAQAAVEPAVLPDPELLGHLSADPDQRRQGLVVLRALVDRTEARSLFRLPVAVDGYVPGFRVHARPDRQRVVTRAEGPAVVLGYQGGDQSAGAEVTVPVAALPRHSFIVGTPGSGKTNTALHLCRQLWQQRVPFLVIEPVNAGLDDYRWLATQPGFEDLLVFTVGDESVAPLRLNPFEVPTGVTIVSHLSNLLACFEAAFGLWDPLPFIYRRALARAYRRRGLHPDDRGGPQHASRWPVLADFTSALAAVTGELGYTGEVGHNIEAAGRLRAEALAEGACGSTLDCRRSFDIGTLLRRPVVVELAGVGDNAKEQALVTLLLLNLVRGYRRGAPGAATTPHVMLIEEAHRVFPRTTPGRGGDATEANAGALAAERIAQGLAEDRKYRQAYILIDQQVGKVAEDAYKITNLKVMHRTAAAEDRELLGATMTLHADQLEAAAALPPFHAVVSHNELDQAVTVQVPDIRGQDAAAQGLSEAPLADDEELRDRHIRLLTDPAFADAMAPYDECHGCRHRCAFRRHAASVAADPKATGQLLARAQPDQGGWPAVARALADLAGPGPATVDGPAAAEDYQVCVFIHAFRTTHPAADRSQEDQRRAVRWTARARQELA
ncbi:MAG: ATP-binding protein, partial [Natronosporangium sp.]